MRISNSKANCYRRCPKKYEYRYIHKLTPKTTGLPLKRGDWLHQMLQAYYTGEPWKQRWEELTRTFNNLFEEEKEEYGDLPGETNRLMHSYVNRWQYEDKGLKVLAAELDETVRLPTGDDFRFIIDLVVEEPDGGVWLWDHKTVSQFMPEDFMLIDTQLARYFWAASKLGYKVRGVLFNELITTPPTIPKQLKTGALEQRANLRCDEFTYRKELERLNLDPNHYADFLATLRARNDLWHRRTRLPRDRGLTKRTMRELLMTVREAKAAERLGHFPRTPQKSCTWDCEFVDPCMVELFGGSADEIYRLKFTRDGAEA